MKFPVRDKKANAVMYGVAAYNGIVTQYLGDSLKEAEDCYFKSHTATHLYKMDGDKKVVLRENQRRMKLSGQLAEKLAPYKGAFGNPEVKPKRKK